MIVGWLFVSLTVIIIALGSIALGQYLKSRKPATTDKEGKE